jgi:transposase
VESPRDLGVAARRGWKDVHRALALSQGIRNDVVDVARGRKPGQTLKQIAADFGIAENCLRNWMRQVDVEDGLKPGVTAAANVALREARKWIWLLEQERGPAPCGGVSVAGEPPGQ